ncbi:MAG TPA: GNAT family N-acetyltransferase [Jatrophihabitans sp.]|nr:GNAT family N-acetyltransferase [Jatrophihabitans sp.]
MTAPRISRFRQAELPDGLRAGQLRLHRQAWPETEDTGHDPALDPVTMLLLDDGDVLAALDILSKQISHRGRTYAASGLSAVVTDEAVRGRGYGLELVRAARRTIAELGRDLGIFTCDAELAGFYVQAGWQLLPGTVLIGGTPEHPFPSDQFDKVTLGAFFTPHARSHATEFEHARVELFPGSIDRLW